MRKQRGAEQPIVPELPPALSDLPEPLGYRIKTRLLGPPLPTERLAHERLGKPTALAVFASDNLSSVSYGTEEILRHLVPYVGVAAFALLMPITLALVVMLGFLVLSYRQTIKAYPSAGGAYVVARDNFGLLPAQVAGVALLIDYVLTVAVSVAAGTAAVTSVAPGLRSDAVPIALCFIVAIAYGNLRGVRESGRVFAGPTYFFLGAMVALLCTGAARMLFGDLPVEPLTKPGLLHPGVGGGALAGASLFVVARAFASGGAAVTGVEAISNGVSAFRPPEWKNARATLVIMASTLGAMFLGLSGLAARMHVSPYKAGSPTVLSQVGRLVFDGGATGRVLYYCLQAGTTLILVLAANTSFADFPRLASFHAADDFMPHSLTKRGHRLVFSNGIITLAVVAGALVIVTRANVDSLVPLYAIGVFLSFTMSQAGMAKRHYTYKRPGWLTGFIINGTGAVLSAFVDLVIAVTKFKPSGTILGAWVVVVFLPIIVAALVHLHRRYQADAAALREDAPAAAVGTIARRHVVYILVEWLDEASLLAIQYARLLHADDVRALHCQVRPTRTETLVRAWHDLAPQPGTLEVLDCRDGGVARAVEELAVRTLAAGETDVTILVPRRRERQVWRRVRANRAAGDIVARLSTLPRCNIAFAPHIPREHSAEGNHVRTRAREGLEPRGRRRNPTEPPRTDRTGTVIAARRVPIRLARARERVTVAGRIHALRIRSRAQVPALECLLRDESGDITVVFLGRRHIPGIAVGTLLAVEGVVGEHHGRLAIVNPSFEILSEPA